MKKRFFTKGEDVKLFYLIIDDEKKELHEYVLKDGKWEMTSELMKIMIDGFQGIREIDENEASNLYKDKGFEDAMKDLGDLNG
jgi:F0F1-type ATP synthase epsilon subunit